MQETSADTTAQMFEQERRRLFAIAYRMLGSTTDAEDIVQEAFVRWLQANQAEVQSPRAYLSTVVVRLCLDQVRSAHARREHYIGPWLPEPIAASDDTDPAETVMLAESLAFAFLVMLQQLAPLERAVFLLHDVFEYGYAEIAAMVGKSEVNCRQVLHRARAHLGQQRARFDVSHEQQERITTQFMQASMSGDMEGLLSLLADDVVFTADSNGKVPAGLKPVQGRDKVARGMFGFLRRLLPGLRTSIKEVNGQPAIVGELDGRLYGIMVLGIVGDQVQSVYMVLNPDKLRWLVDRPM